MRRAKMMWFVRDMGTRVVVCTRNVSRDEYPDVVVEKMSTGKIYSPSPYRIRNRPESENIPGKKKWAFSVDSPYVCKPSEGLSSEKKVSRHCKHCYFTAVYPCEIRLRSFYLFFLYHDCDWFSLIKEFLKKKN